MKVFEEVSDGYVTRWECPIPAKGVRFQVIDERWLNDYRVRVIREIRVIRDQEQSANPWSFAPTEPARTTP